MRTPLLMIFALSACKSEPAIEYVPAKPTLSEGAVCNNFPVGLKSESPGWYDDKGVALSSMGVLHKGDGPAIHNICGKEVSDHKFIVEQAFVFDEEYEKKTDKTRYHVCTGTITRGEKLLHPDATATIELKGHPVCDEISGTYTHKKPGGTATAKEPTTPCARYSACVCALSTAKAGDQGLADQCRQTKDLLKSAEPDDAACKSGLAMMQKTAPTAYGVALPAICK